MTAPSAAFAPPDPAEIPQAFLTDRLMMAVNAGSAQSVQRALNDGANPLARASRSPFTPLQAAAFHGHSECVRILLPFAPTESLWETNPNKNPLWLAIGSRNLEGSLACVHLLLPHSAPQTPDTDGYDALRYAARFGRTDLLTVLASVCDPKSHGPSGETALMLAAEKQDLNSLLALLPVSDPLARNKKGEDALMLAAAGGDARMIDALLPSGDPSRQDNRGNSALMRAINSGERIDITPLIPGSAINAQNQRGESALIRAAHQRDSGAIAALLPHSDLSLRDDQGENAWQIAAATGSIPCLALLAPHITPEIAFSEPRASTLAPAEALQLIRSLEEAMELRATIAQPAAKAPASRI